MWCNLPGSWQWIAGRTIHNLDITWAILGTIGGLFPLIRLLEYRHTQGGRDLFALLITLVAYPWAVAIMHLTPLGKGLVYAICIFTIPLFGMGVLRLLGYEGRRFEITRHALLAIAAALALLALTNPWLELFALFDEPIPGQPNHLLDYQTAFIGAHLTMLFAGVVILGTTLSASLRLLRTRFNLSHSMLGVLIPTIALLAYLNSSLWNLFAELQINPYFLTTTLTLFYFSYLSFRGKISAKLPPAHAEIISLMPDAIVIVDSDGVVVECNPAFESLLGKANSQILTQPLSSLMPQTSFLDDRDTCRYTLPMITTHGEQYFDLHITALSPTNSSSRTGAGCRMILMRDTTEQTSAYQQLQSKERALHRANIELERLSTTDTLTGLRNRRYLQRQLENELERSKREATTFGLLSLDLDHFKSINDLYGHQIGDAVLSDISRVLELQCRATDTLARVGGEEFMVLLIGCDQQRLRDAAERFRRAVEQHVVRTNTNLELSVTTSLGATLVHPTDSMRDLLRRVDQLLYSAKREGRNKTVNS